MFPWQNLLVLYHLLVLVSSVEYEFEKELVNRMSFRLGGDDISEKEYLNQLSTEEHRELCLKAKDYASLGGMEPIKKMYSPVKVTVDHMNGKRENSIALVCPTEPTAFLRMGRSNVHVKITLVDEFLSQFSFDVQVVKSVTEAENFSEKRLLGSTLNRTPEELRHLCNAAKMIASVDDGLKTDSDIGKVAGYVFIPLDETESRRTFPAIHCPTSPIIILRDSERGQIIITHESAFLEEYYVFNVEIIESAVRIEPENEHQRMELERNYFSSLKGGTRWKLCAAAHTRTEPLVQLRWSTRKSFEELGIYDVLYSGETFKERRRVAFPCSTERGDTMFLSPGNSENEFIVMLFKDPFKFRRAFD